MDNNYSNSGFSVKKRVESFKYAFNGVVHLVKTQHNAWIHLFITALVIFSGTVFDISRIEWALIVICIGFVITTEIINTTIEYFVDITSPGYNEKAGRVKDLAAAAVLISSITAAVTGLIIFIPYITNFIKSFL